MKISESKYFIIIFLVFLISTSIASAQIVVIVNKDNPLNDLSLNDLKLIYSGKLSSFDNGGSIVLTQTSTYSEEFYNLVLNKSPDRVIKLWIHLVFSGVSVTPPLECHSAKDAIQKVSNNPGGIGFIDFAEADERIKIITLNIKKPGTTDYPFQ